MSLYRGRHPGPMARARWPWRCRHARVPGTARPRRWRRPSRRGTPRGAPAARRTCASTSARGTGSSAQAAREAWGGTARGRPWNDGAREPAVGRTRAGVLRAYTGPKHLIRYAATAARPPKHPAARSTAGLLGGRPTGGPPRVVEGYRDRFPRVRRDGTPMTVWQGTPAKLAREPCQQAMRRREGYHERNPVFGRSRELSSQ